MKHYQSNNMTNEQSNTSTEILKEETHTKEEWEIQRDNHKAAADNAYRCRDLKTAIDEYTNAITFDPEWHILYSNRSTAYLQNGEKSKALADAKKCVEIKPDFVKGHSRLANALFSLSRYNEARNVYMHILSDLDQNHEVAKQGLEDCRDRIQLKKQEEMNMLRQAQEKAVAEEKEQEEKEDNIKKNDDVNENKDEEDDLLNDFFEEVEDFQVKKKDSAQSKEQESNDEQSNGNDKTTENKIQIQLSDLGNANTQIQRLLCPNHEWYNLNPFRVLDISHQAPMDMISRRYKALSLLLHPDKVRAANSDADIIEKSEQAFEYVRQANNALKEEDKRRHTIDLIEQGWKQGKRDYEAAKSQYSTDGKNLEKYQELATMKIFAEIERKRRDVERRKRKFEEREREQEDAEASKEKKERDFERNWKNEGRVEKRINNWRDFSKKK